MRYLLLIFFLFPIYSFAGVPTELNPDQLEERDISIVLWYEETPKDIKEFENFSSCSLVTVLFPLIDTEQPGYTKVHARSTLRLNGKILTYSDVLISKTVDGKRNTGLVCLPLGAEYEADITFSYYPPDPELPPMCTPSYTLTNIKRFLKKEGG